MSFLATGIALVSLLALLASALFSAAEVAIFSVRAQTLKSLREQKEPRAEWIAEVLAQPRRFLSAILLGNVVSNAIVACGLTLLCHKIAFNGGWCAQWAPLLASVGLLLIFGELLPKAVATQRVTATALGMVGWLRALERLARPLTVLMDRLAQQWTIRITPFSARPIHGLTEDEYVTMLDVGTREGALRPSERRLIERTLHLANRNLRELMTPRSEMCCLDEEMNLDEMKARAAAMRHRRLPICSGSPDSVLGILNAKRFLLEPEADMIACIEPPAFVPETMTALELLKNFLRGPQRMAMVVDEFGGVEGLITLEDIVEEVFGEIYDEYDDASPSWEEIEAGVFVARGSAHLPEVSKWLGVDIEADGIDTLGGWITDRLGAMPRVGDRCSYRGYSFQVEKMQRLRVETLLVRNERKKQ